ncbi:hypothetical protein [Pontiella sulfatireligans]|uniref:N-acetyltransferase domain-containing protein n=1 Tax=Pontiella sulfatireligans TaxID=2750658 RepID=A0A6C2UPQ6_9BACT|nr:hypothetical protein [Pontiella sulfatireligans]VGO21297.1 hypothetical protein SCARR_03369 [Pontiella sulfatireligans]
MKGEHKHINPPLGNSLNSACSPEKVSATRRKNKRNLYKFPLSLFAELIHSENQIPALIDIEQKCFPELMQDLRQNFEDFIQDEYASGLILYKDDVPIGYMMGWHIHEENSAQALKTNEFIKENEDRTFYISSLSIIKEYRSVLALEFLIHEMAALLKSIDYDYFVAFVRKRHGLSRLLTRRLAGEILHTVDDWEETGEAFDYCLVNLESIPTLPAWADQIVTWLRLMRRKLKRIRTA